MVETATRVILQKLQVKRFYTETRVEKGLKSQDKLCANLKLGEEARAMLHEVIIAKFKEAHSKKN
jgi:hypothetical protein